MWRTSDLIQSSGDSSPLKIWSRSAVSVSRVSRVTMRDSEASDCPFCRLPPSRILEENSLAVAVADAYPVSPGHTLVIPKRHSACFFELTADEITAIYELLRRVKTSLDLSFNPAGYNVGI